MQEKMKKAAEFLSSDFGRQFDDPQFRQQAMQIDAMLNDDKPGGDLTADGLYEFANRLFSRELQHGVGEQLPNGDTIVSKRLERAYESEDGMITLELSIQAEQPDGTVYEYQAPATKNRTAAETDEVLQLPAQAVRDRLRGASMLAQGLERAGGREAVLAQLQGAESGEEQQMPPMQGQGERMGLMGPGGVQ